MACKSFSLSQPRAIPDWLVMMITGTPLRFTRANASATPGNSRTCFGEQMYPSSSISTPSRSRNKAHRLSMLELLTADHGELALLAPVGAGAWMQMSGGS